MLARGSRRHQQQAGKRSDRNPDERQHRTARFEVRKHYSCSSEYAPPGAIAMRSNYARRRYVRPIAVATGIMVSGWNPPRTMDAFSDWSGVRPISIGSNGPHRPPCPRLWRRRP